MDMKLVKFLKEIFICAVLASMSTSVFSAIQWNAACTTVMGDTSTCNGDATILSGGITATVSAHTVLGGGTYQDEVLRLWGSSFGAGTGSSPLHAVNNVYDGTTQTVQEFLLISFDWGVSLEEIDLGWVGSSTGDDEDISVLAWNGAPNTFTLAGRTDGQLIPDGWKSIDNFDAGSTGVKSINSGDFSSRFWLVGAYNEAFGPRTNTAGTGPDTGYALDAFKLRAFKGTHTPPDTGVPIPGTAALLALGLMLIRTRKTK